MMVRSAAHWRSTWRGRGAVRASVSAAVLAAILAVTPACAEGFLGRGVNVLSTDGMFDRNGGSDFSFDTFRRLKTLGFDHVRINARPFAHLGADGRLEERWIGVLRKVIDAALAADLKAVVDVHEFLFCQREPKPCEERLAATWQVLSNRLSDYDDRVAFEILNEPGGGMDAVAWNRVLAKTLQTIRRLNPRRKVIVGPAGGNHFSALPALRLPKGDRDILIGVHYYEPFRFTHQGAPWAHLETAVGVDWGNGADLKQLDRDFDAIAAWAAAEGREIYLGEFGVYEKAEPRPRFCWLNRVVRAAETRGWSWSYWQLSSDFAMMDEKSGRWNDWVIAALTAPAGTALCAAQPSP